MRPGAVSGLWEVLRPDEDVKAYVQELMDGGGVVLRELVGLGLPAGDLETVRVYLRET